MERPKKYVKESVVIKNELLMPNDTNYLHNLLGGRLMHWMDIAGGIAAQRHSDSLVVTASVDNISFNEPIEMGSVVQLSAKVTRAFNTSMEVYIEVIAENVPKQKKFVSNTAFFTFVAVDEQGKPILVPEAIPETEREKELYDGAMRRRELRLVMAKRMKLDDAKELKPFLDDGKDL